MAIASLKDLYLDELGDLYDAETQMIRQLPLLAEHAHAPELRDALIKHSQESRLHGGGWRHGKARTPVFWAHR